MKRFTILIGLAACADPVVEMELQLPSNAQSFDTSCVTGIAVYALGSTISQDLDDWTGSCREIDQKSRLTDIHTAIKGQFSLQIPDSGMSGVEIYGWSGPTPCDEFGMADLTFHGFAPYIGQDKLDLQVQTTMDCAKQTVKTRPVDMFKLITGATPGSQNCATAMVADNMGWSGLGQIMEREYAPGVEYYGGYRGAEVVGGVSSFTASTTGLTKSCLAFEVNSAAGFSASCAMTGGKVCAGADEYDAPFIDADIANESLTFDEPLLAKWDNLVFVTVWNNAAPNKLPVAGATLALPADQGEVVYVDPPASGTRLVRRTDGMTGPSGLALVYTNKLADVKVTANGATKDVVVSAPGFSAGAAMIVMP